MRLKLTPHDDQSRAAAVDMLRRVLSIGDRAGGVLADVGTETVELTAPHVGYMLDLVQLREGASLPDASPYADRYLLVAAGRVVGSVDVSRLGDEEPAATRLGTGPYDAAAFDALRTLHSSDADRDDEYEPRFLIVPGLYFAAWWLRGRADFVVPLQPEVAGLRERTSHEAAEALAALRRAALTVRTFPEPGAS